MPSPKIVFVAARRAALVAFSCIVPLLFTQKPASAQVVITVGSEELQIEARKSTLGEFASAIYAKLGIDMHGSFDPRTALDTKQHGSATEVLRGILRSYDTLFEYDSNQPNKISSIIIVGERGRKGKPLVQPPVAVVERAAPIVEGPPGNGATGGSKGFSTSIARLSAPPK